MFTAAGVPKNVWPGGVHAGTDGSRRPHFVHRLLLALDADRATFVFAQPGDAKPPADLGRAVCRGLWAALLAAGRAVEVVVVGRNPERLTVPGRVLDGWVSTPAVVDAHCEAAAARVAEQVRRDEEIASVRAAIATLDEAVLAAYGRLNGTVACSAALETAATVTSRMKPMISTGRTWRSWRVPE